MTKEVTITLQTLRCLYESVIPSAPYLWAAVVSVDTQNASVRVLSGIPADDNVILQSNLESNQSVAIPPSVGVLARSYDDTDLSTTQLILVTALWRKHKSPSNVVTAAYEAFISSLQSAIQANLLELADTNDPTIQQTAITNVKNNVNAAVASAIKGVLSTEQETEIFLHILVLDAFIDSGYSAFTTLTPQSFVQSIGKFPWPVDHAYQIDGALTIADLPCAQEIASVQAATAALQNLQTEVNNIEAQLSGATAAERAALQAALKLVEQKLPGAQTALKTAQQALAACQAQNG
jgi:hypothetical protein